MKTLRGPSIVCETTIEGVLGLPLDGTLSA